MNSGAAALFSDPDTLANYLGENIGTHFSAALRAADAYGRHLAGKEALLLEDRFSGEALSQFWMDMIRSEQVRTGSPVVIKKLGTDPRYYFDRFLKAADIAYWRCYRNDHPTAKKKSGHTQHAQCLRLLRDPKSAGMADRFDVRNQVTLWRQVFQITTGSEGQWLSRSRGGRQVKQ